MSLSLYPLYAFDVEGRLILTRGSTPERATAHIRRMHPRAQLLSDVPLDGPRWYGTNHAPGWLHRAPIYEMRMDADRRSLHGITGP